MANMLDKKAFNEQVRLLFQNYLDESSVDPDTGCIEGMLITPEEAVQFVNDVMLYYQDGEELTESQKVKPGNE